jgi:hypothetical protein
MAMCAAPWRSNTPCFQQQHCRVLALRQSSTRRAKAPKEPSGAHARLCEKMDAEFEDAVDEFDFKLAGPGTAENVAEAEKPGSTEKFGKWVQCLVRTLAFHSLFALAEEGPGETLGRVVVSLSAGFCIRSMHGTCGACGVWEKSKKLLSEQCLEVSRM